MNIPDSMPNGIFVTSHVARDLLQSAALFKTAQLVVWEYVSNGLQYVDSGTNPVVAVRIYPNHKRITITDNGRGMSWEDLKGFFVMHGVNADRRQGRIGRGRFGTGKSAAFGIAELLRVTTTRNGLRSSVELTRNSVAELDSGQPIPLRVIERNTEVADCNGTTIEIEGIRIRSIDQGRIVRYVERHLARWPRGSVVMVNNHRCEYSEPPIARELHFAPDENLRATLGDVELCLKVSKIPLDEDSRGVAIYANGVWCESTLAGSEGRDMGQYIFGDIDVPRLDDDTDPIPAIDQSRSMRLNINNDVVRSLYSFLGPKIDSLRRELVQSDRRRRKDEEARKLARQADEIAQAINDDFASYRTQVHPVQAHRRGSTDQFNSIVAESDGDADTALAYGNQQPANITSEIGGPGQAHSNDNGTAGTSPRHLLPTVAPPPSSAPLQGQQASSKLGKAHRSGGFTVQFQDMGEDGFRAEYVRTERTIYINLEHPQVSNVRGSTSTDDLAFRRLAYEIAFTEYAIALASEMALNDEYIDPSDPIIDIRETLNRISRKGAHLYAK